MSEPRLIDVTGRVRSPAATPGHGVGCAPPNKGQRYPADPPTVEEIILVIADTEGAEMRKLRAEMHRRMLGNGYCARPVGLDCHFESICESCTYFQTTHEFQPILQRQRADAADKGQVGRQKIFDGLLHRLDAQAS
jgi:hypothetical protein